MINDDTLDRMLVQPLETGGSKHPDALLPCLINAYSGVRLTAIIDACHSGTALDLPFVSLGLVSVMNAVLSLELTGYSSPQLHPDDFFGSRGRARSWYLFISPSSRSFLRQDAYGRNAWQDHRVAGVHQGTRGGDAIMLSGCRDDQTSADTQGMAGGVATGAM